MAFFVALSIPLSIPAQSAERRLGFVRVALDQETREADDILQLYLERVAGLSFAPEDLEYSQVVDRLVNWKSHEGHFLARTTPYVYVAAEMLGADLEILATYSSAASDRHTYNAYFVVRRDQFTSPPDLNELLNWLKGSSEPRRFVYHSRFSTSSYFLPSLYFREHGIFNMAERTPALSAINSRQIEQRSSAELVKLVAGGGADIAAVWDGTKVRFDGAHAPEMYERFGNKVHFIRLPATLPNDLLVCSASLDRAVKERLRAAIDAMGEAEINTGDFRTWHSIRQATDARLALAKLRWMARERAARVTVEISAAGDDRESDNALLLVEAARQAVRLSGTEFVLYDEDFHEHIDYRWTLKPIHDNAAQLESIIPGSGLDNQQFQISFRDSHGLTERIESIVRSRLHRIRYVWPYSGNSPIVIRDTSAGLTPDSRVKVQRITWLDPRRNQFRQGPVFDATVQDASLYRYRLDPDDFERSGGGAVLHDAMSNISYRVILPVATENRALFQVLAMLFVGGLVLAAVGGAYDIWRAGRIERALTLDVTRTSESVRASIAGVDRSGRETRGDDLDSGNRGPNPDNRH